LAVDVQDKKTADTSYTWLVVSRATAAVLGGFVVTYWTGPAVVKAVMTLDLFSRANAGPFSGFVQLVVYVAVIIGVCASPSMKKAWAVLAVLTALLAGYSEFGPGPHRFRAAIEHDAGYTA
jgi:hypothetical protein